MEYETASSYFRGLRATTNEITDEAMQSINQSNRGDGDIRLQVCNYKWLSSTPAVLSRLFQLFWTPQFWISQSDMFNPISMTRSLIQIVNIMDQVMPQLRWVSWDSKEDDNTLGLCFNMPGLDKENVKISIEQSTLIIKAEAANESEDDEEPPRRYSFKINLRTDFLKLEEIKAEMKNGVLKIMVPKAKVKIEEIKHVIQVQVK